MRYQRSCFYYRIRKLVEVKKYVDHLFQATQSRKLLMKMVGIYSMYSLEFQEYVEMLIAKRSAKKQIIIQRFVQNLKSKAERGRQERYRREEIQKMEWKARQKERDQRIHQKELKALTCRLKRMENRTFRCYEGMCNGRLFYSKERLEIHRKAHQREKVPSSFHRHCSLITD